MSFSSCWSAYGQGNAALPLDNIHLKIPCFGDGLPGDFFFLTCCILSHGKGITCSLVIMSLRVVGSA